MPFLGAGASYPHRQSSHSHSQQAVPYLLEQGNFRFVFAVVFCQNIGVERKFGGEGG